MPRLNAFLLFSFALLQLPLPSKMCKLKTELDSRKFCLMIFKDRFEMKRIFLALIAAALFLKLVPADAQAAYLLKAGDQLDITVWQDVKLNRRLTVAPDGGVAFPLVGHFRAGGTTVEAVEEHLRVALQKQYKDQLDVSVAIAQIKEPPVVPPLPPVPPIDPSFFVTGEVRHPGKFFFKTRTDVLQAISMAEGLGIFAASHRIQIHRKENGHEYALDFDYDAFTTGKNTSNNIWLRSGDVIVVPEKRIFE